MNKTILIIEDDTFTQELYKFLFDRKGYKYTISDDGEQVLHLLQNNEVGLIILDINLKNTYLDGKKIDGIGIAEFVRGSENYSTIPILVVSAYQSNVNGRNLIKEKLVDDFIVKPIIDFNQLLEKINRFMTQ